MLICSCVVVGSPLRPPVGVHLLLVPAPHSLAFPRSDRLVDRNHHDDLLPSTGFLSLLRFFLCLSVCLFASLFFFLSLRALVSLDRPVDRSIFRAKLREDDVLSRDRGLSARRRGFRRRRRRRRVSIYVHCRQWKGTEFASCTLWIATSWISQEMRTIFTTEPKGLLGRHPPKVPQYHRYLATRDARTATRGWAAFLSLFSKPPPPDVGFPFPRIRGGGNCSPPRHASMPQNGASFFTFLGDSAPCFLHSFHLHVRLCVLRAEHGCGTSQGII